MSLEEPMLPVLSCMKVLARLSWSVAQCWAAKRNISSAKDIQVYRYAQRIYHDIRKWDTAFYYFGSHHLHHFTLAKMQVEIAGRRYRNGGSHGEQEQETRRFKFDRCFPAKKKNLSALHGLICALKNHKSASIEGQRLERGISTTR